MIDRLSHDLKKDFPDMTGLSPPRNLKYMRRFSESWPNREIVQRTVAQIPWGGSNIALLDKLKDPEVRIWYAQKTLEYGWSRDILTIQIENRLHERQGKALNNFDTALPPADSDMASQVFKDPYLFDFLGTADPRKEREVEQAWWIMFRVFFLKWVQDLPLWADRYYSRSGTVTSMSTCCFTISNCAVLSWSN
ncbi:DUF1016 N-terminal domain-containing protein [Methanogenium cariaci]|uniref:DUF1016 N-terminal domain-containing protein n=1 Tax=Methanogenium cariaci TaxID=2197 RepID=UPI000AD3A559|nr:DUF1016 N-terminal domain-containing protein [Methanogenium cariaci]